MAYFIPWLAIGGGIGLAGWGIQQIKNGNDSLDAHAKEILKKLPAQFTEWVETVKSSENGCQISLKNNTPTKIKNEFETYCLKSKLSQLPQP